MGVVRLVRVKKADVPAAVFGPKVHARRTKGCNYHGTTAGGRSLYWRKKRSFWLEHEKGAPEQHADLPDARHELTGVHPRAETCVVSVGESHGPRQLFEVDMTTGTAREIAAGQSLEATYVGPDRLAIVDVPQPGAGRVRLYAWQPHQDTLGDVLAEHPHTYCARGAWHASGLLFAGDFETVVVHSLDDLEPVGQFPHYVGEFLPSGEDCYHHASRFWRVDYQPDALAPWAKVGRYRYSKATEVELDPGDARRAAGNMLRRLGADITPGEADEAAGPHTVIAWLGDADACCEVFVVPDTNAPAELARALEYTPHSFARSGDFTCAAEAVGAVLLMSALGVTGETPAELAAHLRLWVPGARQGDVPDAAAVAAVQGIWANRRCCRFSESEVALDRANALDVPIRRILFFRRGT